MSNFFNAVKAGIGAAFSGPEAQRYSSAGYVIRCPLCAHDRFLKGAAQLHTAGMSFIGLDWAQREAATLACAECSRIEWLLSEPEVVD